MFTASPSTLKSRFVLERKNERTAREVAHSRELEDTTGASEALVRF